MGFDSGSLSFQRFSIVGQSPTLPDEAVLKALADNAFHEDQMSAYTEISYGWCGGRHVLDESFHFGHNVFNDCVAAGLRVDTNKVPSDLKRAYIMEEEFAAAKGNPSGFASKQQKRLARDSAGRRIEEELQSGKHRRSRMTPLLWDLPNYTLYAAVSTKSAEQLSELFERSFKLTLEPMTSGKFALQRLEANGKRRDYEDLHPTSFGAEQGLTDQPAAYPWCVKGDKGKDFLGSEFLMWLWHEAHIDGGGVETAEGTATVMFDKMIDLDCAFGVTGRDTLRATGPTSMPEALEALRTGKVPRKAGIVFQWSGNLFSFTLNGENLGISGLKLPDIEEADSPRVLFEERISLLREFSRGLDALYGAFLNVRTQGWKAKASKISRWIVGSEKAVSVSIPKHAREPETAGV